MIDSCLWSKNGSFAGFFLSKKQVEIYAIVPGKRLTTGTPKRFFLFQVKLPKCLAAGAADYLVPTKATGSV